VPRQLLVQTNFASGEFDETLSDRPDLQRFQNAALTMLNWLPRLQGGADRFPGTRYLWSLVGEARLEDFEAAPGARFLLVFQSGALRIFLADALLQTLVTPWEGAEIWELDLTQAFDTAILTHGNHAPRRLYRDAMGVWFLEDLMDTGNPTHFLNVPQADGADQWSAALGYPMTATFHESRLVLAGSPTYPNRVWFSKTGIFFDFDVGTGLDDEGFSRDLNSDELETILWLYSGRTLLLGTTVGEWAVIQDGYVTPAFCTLRRQTRIGSKQVRPVETDGAVLHLSTQGTELRELLFTDVEQSYGTRPLSVLDARAVSGGKQLAAQTGSGEQADTTYVVNEDGTLGVLQSLRDQEVLNWCRRTFQGAVESAAVVGGEVYLVTRYAFGPGVYEEGVHEEGVYEASGGSTARFLVKLDAAAVLDFQKTVTAAPGTTVWDGFAHLAGSTIQVLLDGERDEDAEVSATGEITTAYGGETLTAGVAIPAPTLTPMPVAFDSQKGQILHLRKRIVRSLVKVRATRALTVDGRELSFRPAHDPFAPLAPWSGVREIRHLGYSREATYPITAPEPFPATVVSITREVAY